MRCILIFWLEKNETITCTISVTVLRLVETTNCRGDLKTPEERKKALCDSLKSDGLKYFANLLYANGSNPQSEEHSLTRKKDHVSHFILRLVYCNNSEQRNWFVNQELEFFKLRFSSLDKKGIESLLISNNIDCVSVCFTLYALLYIYTERTKNGWTVNDNIYLFFRLHLQY